MSHNISTSFNVARSNVSDSVKLHFHLVNNTLSSNYLINESNLTMYEAAGEMALFAYNSFFNSSFSNFSFKVSTRINHKIQRAVHIITFPFKDIDDIVLEEVY